MYDSRLNFPRRWQDRGTGACGNPWWEASGIRVCSKRSVAGNEGWARHEKVSTDAGEVNYARPLRRGAGRTDSVHQLHHGLASHAVRCLGASVCPVLCRRASAIPAVFIDNDASTGDADAHRTMCTCTSIVKNKVPVRYLRHTCHRPQGAVVRRGSKRQGTLRPQVGPRDADGYYCHCSPSRSLPPVSLLGANGSCMIGEGWSCDVLTASGTSALCSGVA